MNDRTNRLALLASLGLMVVACTGEHPGGNAALEPKDEGAGDTGSPGGSQGGGSRVGGPGDTSSPAPVAGGTATRASAHGCVADGQACADDAACCSGVCVGELCATVCLGDGEACAFGADCCSGSCAGRACAPVGAPERKQHGGSQ